MVVEVLWKLCVVVLRLCEQSMAVSSRWSACQRGTEGFDQTQRTESIIPGLEKSSVKTAALSLVRSLTHTRGLTTETSLTAMAC